MSQKNLPRNRILKGLSAREWQRLESKIELKTLRLRDELSAPGRAVDALYFPNTGLVSIVTDLKGGETVEAGTVGPEGFVGTSAVLGAETPAARAFCQIPGEAYRLPIDVFKAEFATKSHLFQMLLRYVNAFMAMLAQSAACNRAHSVEERMARWLLMTHDRVDSDEFPLTQEFLGQMLGVRRPTVSLTAGVLQRAGLIRYSRGSVAVVDRTGLEEVACECYALVNHQFNRIFTQDAAGVSRGPQKRGTKRSP